MEKSLKMYEGMFVLPQTFVKEDQEKAFELITSILKKYEADIEFIDIWDERPLAYEIKHVRAATFILVYFNAYAEAVGKIERATTITDEILRCLIVKPAKNFDLEKFKIESKDKKVVEEVVEEKKEEVVA